MAIPYLGQYMILKILKRLIIIKLQITYMENPKVKLICIVESYHLQKKTLLSKG